MTGGQVWDVAVLGGGPAGAMAAHTAAVAGARVVLLERARLPRYKTCGGGLTAGSTAALPAGFTIPAAGVAHEVTFSWRTRHARSWSSPDPLVTLVERATFDAALVEHAARAGAEVREQVTVTTADDDGSAVTLTTSAGPLRARSVVVADGTGSRSRGRSASYPPRSMSVSRSRWRPRPRSGSAGTGGCSSTGGRCRAAMAGSSPRARR